MFSIKEAVRVGWGKMKNNFWKVVGLMLVIFLPSLVLQIVSYAGESSESLVAFVFFVLFVAIYVLTLIIQIGGTKVFIRIFDGENPSLKEAFSAYGIFWKYIGTSILYALIVLGGLILLIVPGLIWAIKYSFAPFLVIDKGLSPKAALKESGAMTQGTRWRLVGFAIVVGLVNLLGYLALGIGVLVTGPVTILAYIHVYRKLGERLVPTTMEGLTPITTSI